MPSETHYPLVRSQYRHYPPDFSGPIYIWDIDKTYLATEIASLREMALIPFEFAIDKRNIAGTVALLHGLRRGRAPIGQTASNPIYFVSASPPQLRRVIERKMLLDGVAFDGITFKDHLQLLRRGRVRSVREQIGYKVNALLLNRRENPWDVQEVLFGDDSESDALIYTIYADIVAGHLRGKPLKKTLMKHGVNRRDARAIVALAEPLPKRPLVKTIYIHLATGKDPSLFDAYGPRLVACDDSFQTALRLYEEGDIDTQTVLSVGNRLITQYRQKPPSLLRSTADLLARGHLNLSTVEALWPDLRAADLVPPYFILDPEAALPDRIPTTEGPWLPE